MAGAGSTLQLFRQWARVDGGAETVGVHDLRGGGKHHVHTLRSQLLDIGIQGAGVGVEVFARPELERVHKNADHHSRVRYLLGVANEGEVPFMQGAHSGDEGNVLSGVADCGGSFGEVLS